MLELLSDDEGIFAGVLRSKGFAWIASRHDLALAWEHAGTAMRLVPTGVWWAAVPRDDWPAGDDAQEDILSEFESPYGDRRQEIVFIGIAMDQLRIEAALDTCLLTTQEYEQGPDAWRSLEDPWPTDDTYDPHSVL